MEKSTKDFFLVIIDCISCIVTLKLCCLIWKGSQSQQTGTKTVGRISKSFLHRKSFDAKTCDQPTTSALHNKVDEPPTSANKSKLETASDLTSEILSLLYPKLSSSLFCTSFVHDFLTCESGYWPNNTLTSSSQTVIHSCILISRHFQSSTSSRKTSTSSSISASLRQNAQSFHLRLRNLFYLSLIFHFHWDLPLVLENLPLFTNIQDPLILVET